MYTEIKWQAVFFSKWRPNGFNKATLRHVYRVFYNPKHVESTFLHQKGRFSNPSPPVSYLMSNVMNITAKTEETVLTSISDENESHNERERDRQ